MADVILDAFLDSLKILAVVAVCTFAIAFLEPLFSKKVRLKGKLAPLIGVSISLLPQCGFSVVAADLYQKRHITLGTLIGVFLATSDEALPIFLSYPDKALHVLPLLLLKFALGLAFGYLIDFIYVKNRKSVSHHVKHCKEEYAIRLMHCAGAERIEKKFDEKVDCIDCNCEECTSSDCNKHGHIHEAKPKENGILSDYFKKLNIKTKKKDNIKRYLFNPLFHSLEIFVYVFVINIIFGVIIYYVGQQNIINFLLSNKYIAPLLSVLIGAIPNCASSIILSELYIMGGLGFGATLGGLCMNAGIAFTVLFKSVKNLKHNLAILGLMFLISIFISYIFSLIFNFGLLPF